MTYTEEQVNELVQANLKLAEENAKLKDQLSEETLQRESAEKKYDSLCERCINFYITERDIETDTIFVQVNAPRFMQESDFKNAVAQSIITLCNAEREKTILNRTTISQYKPK